MEKLMTLSHNFYISVGAFATVSLPIHSRILERLDIGKLDNLVVVEVLFTFIFSLLITADVITGIQASKVRMAKLKRPPTNAFKSYKGWRSVWKFLGVMILVSMIGTLSIATIILDQDIAYYFSIWLVVFIWFISCGVEYQSIGENLEVMYGSKPRVFSFFDRLFNTVERSGFSRISKTISGENDTYMDSEFNEDYREDYEEEDK